MTAATFLYTPPDLSAWTGRTDAAEGPGGRRWHQIIQPLTPASAHGVALAGFASDAGVRRNHGRPGASQGPAAIRTMLGNMPVRDCTQLFDAGTIAPQTQTDGNDGLEAAQAALSELLAAVLAQNLLPITLGGGHEMAFGSFGGLARHLETQAGATPRIGIVNLDAHFDLRQDDRASSGTPFRQIAEDCRQRGWLFNYCCLGVSRYANTQALFERAAELGVSWMLDEEVTLHNSQAVQARLDQFLRGVDHVYFTICLDVLPAATVPGVSAPAARGVALDMVELLVDQVIKSGKMRLADIAELNPRFDIDQHSARVAARLVARIANGASADTGR